MNPTDRPERILIVEDDEATAFIIRKRLQRSGYEVVLANDAEAALKLLDERPFDLVLSDVMMGKTSGFELCRQIRACERTSHLPVILVSARDETESIVSGLDAGADDYLAKPFNPEELLARVRTHLRIKDLQEKLIAAEQLKVAGELAGAAAHEINQPLTILMGHAEMLLSVVEGKPDLVSRVKLILQSGEEIARVLKSIQGLRGYKTKPYVSEGRIVDLQASSEGDE
jgi:DNA-binding response OmpR family regulator